MVDIAPFNAIRYNTEKTGVLDNVLAPPYDVINAALHDELYERSPHNVVRIDFNRTEGGDEEGARYERAWGFMSTWLEDGVLAQDEAPGIYVLAQTFSGPDGVELGRGLVAYSADDARLIMGHKSRDIEDLLGYRGRDEMIHRDDLALF